MFRYNSIWSKNFRWPRSFRPNRNPSKSSRSMGFMDPRSEIIILFLIFRGLWKSAWISDERNIIFFFFRSVPNDFDGAQRLRTFRSLFGHFAHFSINQKKEKKKFILVENHRKVSMAGGSAPLQWFILSDTNVIVRC